MGIVRIGVVLVTLTTAFSAAAEDREAARRAYLEGSKYYNLNQYSDALEAFKRAYWNYEEPSFLYNIAQCHRALKHNGEAIEFYRSYLRNAPNAPNRAEVQHIIVELDAAANHQRAVATAPPEGTLAAPSPMTGAPSPSAPAAAVATTLPPPVRADKPVWKRGWVWGVVAGAAAVVAVGVGIGVGVGASSPKDPSPSFGSVKVN